jgi:hypothetical protein
MCANIQEKIMSTGAQKNEGKGMTWDIPHLPTSVPFLFAISLTCNPPSRRISTVCVIVRKQKQDVRWATRAGKYALGF